MNLIGLLWEELEWMVNKSISEIEKVKAVHFMLENIGYLIKDNLHVKIKLFFKPFDYILYSFWNLFDKWKNEFSWNCDIFWKTTNF